MGLPKGGSAIPETERNFTGQAGRIPYFSFKKDTPQLVRFLTDYDVEDTTVADEDRVGGINWAKNHSFAPTIPAPADYDAKTRPWPVSMSAVCRKSPGVVEEYDGDCVICDVVLPNKPKFDAKQDKAKTRGWGIAVLRKIVTDDGGKILGYADETRTVTVKGKDEAGNETTSEIVEPAVVIINKSDYNFWGNLKQAHVLHGTILNRDWLITEEGEGLQTKFKFASADPVMVKNAEGQDVVYDMRVPEFALPYLPRIAELGSTAAASDEVCGAAIFRLASDEHYGRYFDNDLRDSLAKNKSTEQKAAQATVPTPPVDDAQSIASLRARLEQNGAVGSPVGAPAPAPPEAQGASLPTGFTPVGV